MIDMKKTTGLTKDEMNWLSDRISEGDTDWLRNAMSDYLRKKLEEDARSKGKSLLQLYMDRSCFNNGHEENDSVGGSSDRDWDSVESD